MMIYTQIYWCFGTESGIRKCYTALRKLCSFLALDETIAKHPLFLCAIRIKSHRIIQAGRNLLRSTLEVLWFSHPTTHLQQYQSQG